MAASDQRFRSEALRKSTAAIMATQWAALGIDPVSAAAAHSLYIDDRMRFILNFSTTVILIQYMFSKYELFRLNLNPGIIASGCSESLKR